MRDVLRTIREVQTRSYLSQVINEVVPLANEVINDEPEAEFEIAHHSCTYPNGAQYVGSFRVDKFRAAAPSVCTHAHTHTHTHTHKYTHTHTQTCIHTRT
jgi:hypothetical protein